MRKMSKTRQTRAFRRLRKSLIALLIVVCGKSLYNKHFYNVNKHVGRHVNSDVICSVSKLRS